MGFLLVYLACLLYAAQSVCAWQMQPSTAARQYHPRATTTTTTTTLEATQHNELLEFFQKKDKKHTFSSVEDFDQDLADEIKDALLIANVDGMIGSRDKPPSNEQPTSPADSEYSSRAATQITSEKQPPIQNKVPRIDKTPPHTSLAQVMANQLNIDLSSVTPSKPDSKKITASDVEYHAWKLSQPPSTEEALTRAHQLGLDLNTLYDDEDREYVMQISDVILYEQNIRSLKVVSQKRRGVSNVNTKKRQRMKKLSALDERMEKRMEFLAKKLGNVAGGLAKRVQTRTDFKAVLNGIEKKKDAPEIKSVEDFDAALAIEIQEALMCAASNNESDGHLMGSAKSPQSINDADSEVKSVQDFNASLAVESKEALSCADSNNESDSHIQNIEPDKPPKYIDADANDKRQSISNVDAAVDQLKTVHTSMTVADMKGELRTLGMKVSGNKSELAKRLCTLKRLQSMTVEQLKQELRNQDLKVGGKKSELVERLLDAEENEKEADRYLFFVDM